MSEPVVITSPHAPDVDHVRSWMEDMIKGLKIAQLITAILALITRMRDLNTELTKRLADSRRRRPRSETLVRVERQLIFAFACMIQKKDEAEPAAPAGEGTTLDKRLRKSRKGRHPGRAALPPHLERVPDVNPVPADKRVCPLCGETMTLVGHSTCEILDVRPASLYVRVRLDERVACPNDDTIVSAETPPELVERGKLGTTLIVESLSDKYLEHVPIERQCLRWSRSGVDIAPQTMGRAVGAAINTLAPIAKLISAQTRSPGLLATDATGIPVLDQDAPDGIRNGTMWCWTNARWVTFFYSPTGDANSVRRFLGEDLCRTVQCDGTSITNFIERAGGKRPGCWSHARRRLVEAARGGDKLALDGLRIISRLFAIERESALDGATAAERLARRQEKSRPVINEIRRWIDDRRGGVPPKTPLGAALGYLDRQWGRLLLFLDDGNIELTNNRVEREIRKLVLGRRNWLFTWEDLGGERTATILTVVGTCVAQGINPRAYLHLAIKLLINGWPQAKLRELLPDRLAATHPELLVRDAPPGGVLRGLDEPARLPQSS